MPSEYAGKNHSTLVCDFCTNPNPAWTYRAASYEGLVAAITTEGEVGPTGSFSMEPDWLACDSCRAVIEAGDPQQLARIGVDAAYRDGTIPNRHLYDMLIETTIDFQKMFWETKVSPPEPYTGKS